MPPNTQGVAALSMLNILESHNLAGMGPNSADALLLEIECYELAVYDLQHVGDPRAVTAPVKGMLDKVYGAHRAALIDPRTANCKPAPSSPPSSDLFFFTVVDREGIISFPIQSLFRT